MVFVTGLRRGTGLWVAKGAPENAPTPALPVHGEGEEDGLGSAARDGSGGEPGSFPARAGAEDGLGSAAGERAGEEPGSFPPRAGGSKGGRTLVPIEHVRPGDPVLCPNGRFHSVGQVVEHEHRLPMIGIRHSASSTILWLTANKQVLAKLRPRSLGGNSDWNGSPPEHLARRRELRRNATPAERKLWQVLRGDRLGVSFRRQHPIGPYIADFYSRSAHLVVEVDGATHAQPVAVGYDADRNAYMRSLGLDVLRFANSEVENNLEGVWQTIADQCCRRLVSFAEAKRVQSHELAIGDLIIVGPEQTAAIVESVESIYSDEMVFDIEVDGERTGHAF